MAERTDLWAWQAIHQNGTVYDEWGADGSDHSFLNVPTTRIKVLHLIPEQPGYASPAIVIPPRAKAICYRQRMITIHTGSGEVVERHSIHVIGWQRGKKRVLLFCYEDGSLALREEAIV